MDRAELDWYSWGLNKNQPHLPNFTALRSTPELASPGVKISFLFKGFLLLFPIRDLIDAKKFDANFPSALAASICFLDAKIWKLASEDPFLASK